MGEYGGNRVYVMRRAQKKKKNTNAHCHIDVVDVAPVWENMSEAYAAATRSLECTAPVTLILHSFR
jgi:hypothetical protein